MCTCACVQRGEEYRSSMLSLPCTDLTAGSTFLSDFIRSSYVHILCCFYGSASGN